MSRLLSRFVLTVTALLGLSYTYVAWRLAATPAACLALAFPFLLVWIVPVFYRGGDKERHGPLDAPSTSRATYPWSGSPFSSC